MLVCILACTLQPLRHSAVETACHARLHALAVGIEAVLVFELDC